MEAFTFGEPVPVLDRRDILDYVECISNGRWYEPPVSFTGLAKACVLPCITAHRFTSNVIFWLQRLSRTRGFPSRISAVLCWIFWCSVMRFWKSVTAPPVKVIRLETSPAKYTRRGVEEDVYWWVPSFNEPTPFAPGSVFHLLEPDINQELYGLPEYLSALNSAAE